MNVHSLSDKSDKLALGILVIILIASTFLKVLPVQNYNFPFTIDQGRDMLDLRRIVQGQHLTLIGPTTSINGVFLGPFWYYFNLPPYLLGQGDPIYLVYWMILWYQIAAVLVFLVLRKFDKIFSLICAVFLLTVPAFFYSSRFSWSANPMPVFLTFYFLTLISFLNKPTLNKSLLLGFISGLTLQIEASLGAIVFPFTLLTMLIYKKLSWKLFLTVTLGFFFTLLPQLIFDLKNNFMISRNFFSEIFGQTAILGEKLNLKDTFFFHLNDYQVGLNGIWELPPKYNPYLFLGGIVYLIWDYFKKNKKSGVKKQIMVIFLLFLFSSFLFYMHYRFSLKVWYMTGLYIPLIFLLALFFTSLFRLKNKLITILSILALLYLISGSLANQLKFIKFDQSTDRSNLSSEIKTVDWVYQKASGAGFKVYSYLPSVYDFPYQYLFWWYGTKKYGYQPETITYLDNVPEYITGNEKFWTKTRPVNSNTQIFLIIEKNDERPVQQYAWRGNFTKYCPVEEKVFPWTTKVEILQNCPKK